MGAIWFLARTEMRHRWLGAAVLVVLVGIVGGAVLASVAGARRTSSSLTRFERATNSANLEFSASSISDEQLAEVRRIRPVVDVGVLRQLAMFNTMLGFLPTAGPVDADWGRTMDRPLVVEGRRARGANELDIGPGLAKRTHLRVGDRLQFQSFTQQNVDAQINSSTFDPRGPTPVLRVVGIVRRPLDLGARGDTGGVIVPTRAFMDKYREIGSFPGGTVLRVRTANGDDDAAPVTEAMRRIFRDDPQFTALGLGVEGQGAQSAINVTTAALWILAAVAAIAGTTAIAFALARRTADEVDDQETLRALGFARRQWWAATTAQVAPIAVGGAVLSVALAWLLSSAFPFGVGRDAEPDPGIHFDALTLLLGAVVIAGSVLVVGALAAAVVTRRRLRGAARPSRVARAVNDAGVAPPVAVGIGFALGRGRGRAIPVWSTIGATTVGVVGVVAALVFAGSLDRLVDTPARYGWTWGYVLDGYGDQGEDACPRSDPASHEAGISALAQFCFADDISVGGRPAVGSSIRPVRGRIDPAIVHGRAPRNPREIALGRQLLASTGHAIGDQVVVGAGDRHRKYDIVGTTLLPGLGEAQPLAGGALFTVGGLERVATDSADVVDNYVIVRLEGDADQARLLRRLQRTHADLEPIPATVPAEIERLRQIDAFPALLAGLTVVIAGIALGYTLVVSVRRRRRELAILRTVGFTRGQVRATVAWQATTLAVIGLGLGIVIGFVVGERVWHAVAEDLGVSPSIAVPVLGVVLLIPLTVLVANVIAAVPARSAARTPPAVTLRAE
jgi:ABC-type antimicrobial peptide transport system permease subunit